MTKENKDMPDEIWVAETKLGNYWFFHQYPDTSATTLYIRKDLAIPIDKLEGLAFKYSQWLKMYKDDVEDTGISLTPKGFAKGRLQLVEAINIDLQALIKDAREDER